MIVGLVTLKMKRTETGKYVHRCGLLAMANRNNQQLFYEGALDIE